MPADPISEILSKVEDKMKKAISSVQGEFATVRTGRASASLLENIMVNYYGTETPLKQLAGISTPEPQLVVIQPWDKNTLSEVEKAILKSDLGLTPTSDGQIVRLPFPPLTEERRAELVKMVKRMAEGGRIAIRNVRREANENLRKLEREKKISQDDLERAQHQVQEITDKHVQEVDQTLERKEKEITEL